MNMIDKVGMRLLNSYGVRDGFGSLTPNCTAFGGLHGVINIKPLRGLREFILSTVWRCHTLSILNLLRGFTGMAESHIYISPTATPWGNNKN